MSAKRYSSQVHDDERTFMRDWTARLLEGTKPVFSFQYDGRPSAELLAAPVKRVTGDWVDTVRRHTLSWQERSTGLACMLDVTEYSDFPAVEWVVRFRNDGPAPSPVLTDARALDLSWQGLGPGTPILHRSRGSDERLDDFQYLSEEMRDLRSPLSFRMTSGESVAASCRKCPRGRTISPPEVLVTTVSDSACALSRKKPIMGPPTR